MGEGLKKLPMIDDNEEITCCSSDVAETIYGDPAGETWVSGRIETGIGTVYRISTTMETGDLLGAVKARWGFGRMNYTVPPGLYAVGEPAENSPVLVSANYKLSFDHLRRELKEIDAWVLVLDTKGVNVWCAAGKGTFGTAELLRMVNRSRIVELVAHRNLILPQLSAPGVSAHLVRKESGFRVIYGPVRAADLSQFIYSGNKAEPDMRRTSFKLKDRLVLAPVELVGMFVPLAIFAAFILVLNLISGLVSDSDGVLTLSLSKTAYDLFPFIITLLVGIILVPALLPYIPGRALAWKGWLLGMIWAIVYTSFTANVTGWAHNLSLFLLLPAIPAFLGMNFTGSTTYTSLSGVIKEMEIALPLIIISGGLGAIALVLSYFI